MGEQHLESFQLRRYQSAVLPLVVQVFIPPDKFIDSVHHSLVWLLSGKDAVDAEMSRFGSLIEIEILPPDNQEHDFLDSFVDPEQFEERFPMPWEIPGFENDDASAMTLRLTGDCVANLSHTYALFHAEHTGALHGVQVHVIGRHLHAWWRGRALDIVRPEGIETVEGGPDFDAQCREFVAASADRRPDAVQSDMTDSLRTLAVTLAANESAETGEVVHMAEYMERHGAADPWS